MLKQRFIVYAESFLNGEADFDRNIKLKIDHSLRVRSVAAELTVDQPERFRKAASFASLLHDLGRFEQFRDFQTFDDRLSFDHGDKSAELLEKLDFLRDTDEGFRAAVIWAVQNHNKLHLAELPDCDLGNYTAKIVRDADKTDIFTVLLDYLANPDNPAVVWKLSGDNSLSPKVASALSSGKCPAYADFHTELDFLASKFNWAYDLNTAQAKKIFITNDYLGKLAANLPDTPEMRQIYLAAEEHLTK